MLLLVAKEYLYCFGSRFFWSLACYWQISNYSAKAASLWWSERIETENKGHMPHVRENDHECALVNILGILGGPSPWPSTVSIRSLHCKLPMPLCVFSLLSGPNLLRIAVAILGLHGVAVVAKNNSRFMALQAASVDGVSVTFGRSATYQKE